MIRFLLACATVCLTGCPSSSECEKNSDCGDSSACVSGACTLIIENNTQNSNRNDMGDTGEPDCECPEGQQCNAAGQCVGCVEDLDCNDNSICIAGTCVCETGTHACSGQCVFNDRLETCDDQCEPCGDVQNGTPICDPNTGCSAECDANFVLCETCSNLCAECLPGGGGCANPLMPICVDGTCSACSNDDDCSGQADAKLCSEGACVECTKDDESACAGNSCDVTTGLCTTTPVGSVDVCRSCLSDSACGDGRLCVPMEFEGIARLTGYCLDLSTNGCTTPYGTVVQRTSLSGTAGSFCGIREDLTTCEGVLSYKAPCAQAGDCTDTGLADTVCEPIEFDVAACSFPCDNETPDQCPDPFFGCLDARCGGY